MKKYLYIILFLITGMMVSCVQDDTAGISRVTNYPVITLNGPSEIYVSQGSNYVDAGAESTEGGSVIPTTTTYSNGTYFGSPFSTDVPDQYVVTYTATNADGFPGSALKTIWVTPPTGDFVNSIEGLYLAEVYRGTEIHSDLKYIFIYKTGTNTYAISNANAGFYDLGRGYGPDYAALGGTITVNDLATNDITSTPGFIPGFGLTITMSDFQIDAANKTITFTNQYNTTTGIFHAKLTQVQF